MATATRTKPVDYPTSDGKPMAETDLHRKEMTRLIQMLERWFAADPMVYVSGNLLVYYERGNPRKHVAPDVFIVRGVAKKDRLYYLTWQERKYPTAIIEVTSKTTRREDMHTKMALYRDLFKVKEYFMFDPTGDYLDPVLQGFRRVKGEYVPLRMIHERMTSKELGLQLGVEGGHLMLLDPATGRALLTPEEDAEQERGARQQAEARQAELQAEIERLRRQLGNRGNGTKA